MKRILFVLIILVLIISCAKQPESQELTELKEQPTQEEIESLTIIIPNLSTRQHGFEVNFTGPELRYIEQEPALFFEFKAKDLLNRTFLRNPEEWNLLVYYLANNVTRFSPCLIEKINNNLWSSTFCMTKSEIPDYWYNRELHLIYTNNTLKTYEQKTIARIRNMENAIVIPVKINNFK